MMDKEAYVAFEGLIGAAVISYVGLKTLSLLDRELGSGITRKEVMPMARRRTRKGKGHTRRARRRRRR